MSAPARPAEKTAAEAYAARQADIAALIDVLQMELENHAGRAQDNPKNWGYVGDLSQVRHTLREVLASISPASVADIDEFLAEIHE